MHTKENKWTKTEWIVLKRMRTEGKTWREVAERLGRTEEACKRYAYNKDTTWAKRLTQKPTLCWECGLAAGGEIDGDRCPWADNLEPVEGWTAERVKRRDYTGPVPEDGYTWLVEKCPLFTHEEPDYEMDDDTAIELFGEIIRGMAEEFVGAEAALSNNKPESAKHFLWLDYFFGDTLAGDTARGMLDDYEKALDIAVKLV